jgi:ribosomal-protein-serine acetyltransferase
MFRRRLDTDTELRLLEPKQAPQVHDAIERSRLHLRQWLGWLDHDNHIERTREYIRAVNRRMEENGSFDAGIWFRDEFAGVVGFHTISWAHRSTAIGYWLAADCQGRGLMTASCRAMLDHAFGEMGLNRVEIRAATGNARSRAVPVRLGLQHEGTLHQAEWLYDHFVDLEVYAMLRGDWGKFATGGARVGSAAVARQ